MTWPLVPLSAVAEVSGGSTPRSGEDRYWDGSIPWVTPTDLPMPGAEIADVYTTRDHITEEGISSISAPMLQPGTVLFSSRASIGKIGIARVPLATNQGFANFTPNQVVDSKFLAYCLQYFTPQIASLAGSTTFKEVSRGSIRKFKIPLPPPSEQRRIVEILDQADALRRLRTEADAKAQRILPALFLKMFGDPATNPMGWPVSSLEQEVEIGTELVDPNLTRYLELPHIGGENIERETGIILPYKKVRESALKSNKFYFSKEHVLYSKIRPYLNKVAFPEFEGVCSADIYPLRPRSGKITQWYLIGLLRLPSFLRYAAIHSERLRMPKLNREQLGAFPIPLPDIDILRTFDRQARDIAVAASLLAARRDRIEELLSLFTHRAFSGELTARWREAHREQLCAEMAEQAKLLKLPLPEAARALA